MALPEAHRAFIDLNGEEATYPTENFVAAFRDLVRRKVPVVIHAGEFGEPHATQASLESALDIRPQRIAMLWPPASGPIFYGELLTKTSSLKPPPLPTSRPV